MFALFGSKKKASVSNVFGCVVEPHVFDVLLNEWKDKVAKASANNVVLPNEITQEFQKRLNQRTEKDSSGMIRSGVKAKLSLNNKNLSDDIIILLLEIFLKHPVISKLELHKNKSLTNNAGSKIIEFLKTQVKYCSTVNIDERLATPMLCEITIDGCSMTDSVEIEIIQLSNILKYCNAKLYIRKKFISYGSPSSLSEEFYEQIWIDMFGKSDKKEVHELFMMREKNEVNTAVYDDLEKAFIHILTVKAVLPVLTTAQLLQLEPVNVSSIKSKASVVSATAASSSSGSPHSISRGNSGRSDHGGHSNIHNHSHSHGPGPSPLTESHLNLHSLSHSRLATIKEDKIDERDESTPSISNAAKSSSNNKRHTSPPLSHHRMSSAAIVIDPTMSVPLPLQVLINQPVSKSPPLSPNRLNGIFKEDKSNPDQSRIGSNGVNKSLIHGHETGSLSVVPEHPKAPENRKPKPNLSIVPMPSKPFIAGSSASASSPVRSSKSANSPIRGRSASPKRKVVSRTPSPEKKDKSVAKVVIDFSNSQYVPYAALLKPIGSIIGQSGHSVNNIRVLILKDNSLTDNFVSSMKLSELKHLTDLDLGKNNLSLIFDIENMNSIASSSILPPSLLRLDISHNKLKSISALVSCLDLQVLNVSNNKLATVDVLPLKLERLDVSDNELKHLRSLRVVSMCHRIQALGVAGNPFLQSTNVNINIRVFDMFPNLIELDGIMRPGGKINKAILSARKANVEVKVKGTNNKSRKAQLESDRERSIRRKEQRDSEKKKSIEVKFEEEIQEHYKTIKKLELTEINHNCRRLSTSKTDLANPYQHSISMSSIMSRRSTALPASNITPFERSTNTNSMMSVHDAVELADDWILHCTHEVGRAVEVARLAFDLCLSTPVLGDEDISIIDPQLLENFSNGLDRISLLHHSNEVERAITSLNYYGESESEAKLSTTIENMTHLVTILKKIQKKTKVKYLTREDLAVHIDRIMNTDTGKYVNSNVLSLFGCSYDSFLFASILNMDKNQNTDMSVPTTDTDFVASTQHTVQTTTNDTANYTDLEITPNIQVEEQIEASHAGESIEIGTVDISRDNFESRNIEADAFATTLAVVEDKIDVKEFEDENPQPSAVVSPEFDAPNTTALVYESSNVSVDLSPQVSDSNPAPITATESDSTDNLASPDDTTQVLASDASVSVDNSNSDKLDTAVVTEDTDVKSKRPSTVIRYCDACSAIANFNCGKCHDIYYCSKSCQTKSWKAHKKVCAGVVDLNKSTTDIEEVKAPVAEAGVDNSTNEVNVVDAPLSGETKPPAFVPSGLSLKERLAARVASIKEVK
jgi:hypothetical protein